MVNVPHLFKDLKLGDVGEVEGIKSGLDIKGTRTFKFKIKDDNGMKHEIKIPNSLYVPELRSCRLSPQHGLQEAKDNHPQPKGMRMSQDDFFMYIGIKPNSKSRVPTICPPMFQSSSLPLCCAPTVHSPPLSKPSKHPSSDGRRSSNSQGLAALLTSPNLYLKSLWRKRM